MGGEGSVVSEVTHISCAYDSWLTSCHPRRECPQGCRWRRSCSAAESSSAATAAPRCPPGSAGHAGYQSLAQSATEDKARREHINIQYRTETRAEREWEAVAAVAARICILQIQLPEGRIAIAFAIAIAIEIQFKQRCKLIAAFRAVCRLPAIFPHFPQIFHYLLLPPFFWYSFSLLFLFQVAFCGPILAVCSVCVLPL